MTLIELRNRYNYYTNYGRYKLSISELHQITNNYFFSLDRYPLSQLLKIIDESTNDDLFLYNILKLIKIKL